jgi:exopolysaccharide production protein ExoQ
MSATLTLNPTAPTAAQAQDDDPSLFRRSRTWWLLLALFLMAQGNGIFTRPQSPGKNLLTVHQYIDSSTTMLVSLTGLMWVVCLGLMVKSVGPTVRMMFKQKAVLAFAVLAFLSTLWSQDPDFTFRRAMLLLLSFAFAWFFAISYSPGDQVRLLLTVGVIAAVASICMVALFPQYGLDSGGEWKGVFAQKNRLGLAMLFLFSGLPFLRIASRRRLLTVGFQAILAIGLIVMSRSKGSLVLAFLLIAIRFYGPFVKHSRRDQLPFILYATVTGILTMALGAGIILALLGRDSTLSGRTNEWSILAHYAMRHVWLGYGFYGFWIGGDSILAMQHIRGAIHGADSGYMDALLQFGLVGICLLLMLLLVSIRDFLRAFRGPSMPLTAYWYAGVIIATFIGSFTETLFPSTSGLNTFGLVIACAGLRRIARKSPTMTL